ncbi:MAG: SUMF1/EgtB/PvdO family nonheme iron enzyme [Acidobacteriota bacterium]
MKRGLLIVALMACAAALVALAIEPARVPPPDKKPGMALVPAGSFEMGDHHGFVDPAHGSDEIPVHTVRLDAFYIGVNDVTNKEYGEFLNAAFAEKQIVVRDGGVYLAGGNDLLFETRAMSPYSRIGWDGQTFAVLDRKEQHPVVCVRWTGAAAYANWLSARDHVPAAYTPAIWDTDFNKSGYRLPTEAEWEYAARGGQQTPYRNYPWGDDADAAKANWPESANPFRTGPQPWTTPVGLFDGKLHRKVDVGWPGAQETYRGADGVNGYGLYDMAGNVWQWVNDWYERDYYSYGPADNPPGPDRGSVMPDGKTYRGMRGGNWYNGEHGHGRVSNRDPSYFRGPQDPNHPYYHIGFRLVLPVGAETRPVIKPTPVQRAARNDARPDTPGVNAGDGRQGRGRGDQRGDTAGDGRRRRAVPAGRPADAIQVPVPGFILRSPDLTAGSVLPKEFTGDGASATLGLEWSGAPAGTASYALIMDHVDPQGVVKWYWTLFNIPPTVQRLSKNAAGIGTLGTNSINGRIGYAPPRSKGPGPKTYVITVYALSSAPPLSVPGGTIGRSELLAAIKGRVVGTAELAVVYTREGEDDPAEDDAGRLARDGRQADHGPSDRSDVRVGQGTGDPQRGQAQNDPQRGGGQRGGGRGQGGRGGAEMAENKLPASPNPGQTVGLYLNTPKASPGYTLLAPKHNLITYLIDNGGRIVNQWKSGYEPGQSAYLLPNGHLLRAGMMRVRGGTGGGEGGRIEEFDWNGKLVWEFEHATTEAQLHHDIKPMPNGHVLALMVERKSIQEAVAAGFDANALRDDYLVPDAVVEIEPTPPRGGRIVWEWHVWDHLVGRADPAAHPELVDPKGRGRGIPAFWNHMNSLDYNAALDQIVLSVRGNDEIWIIDHSTTKAEAAGHAGGRSGKGGDLIYRWGNPAAYGRGTAADRQLIQQHDALWIPPGSPGAGHMTIFNNGYERGWSSIEEIVLPVDANGRYAIGAGQPYGPDKPVWHYEAKTRTDFFSSEISGAHRLPNGNTLICAGVVGHLFEVTPAGDIVWQYVNPMVRGGILAQGETPGKDNRGHLFNAVFKVHRYAPDYPGLAGRDLTPKGVIELPASEKGKTGLDKADEVGGRGRGGRGRGGDGGQQGRRP